MAHLRKNETLAQVGAGFGVSEATAWRYVAKTVEILVAWASGLREALVGLGEGDFIIVDGTLIPTDWGHLRAEGWGRPRPSSRTTPTGEDGGRAVLAMA